MLSKIGVKQRAAAKGKVVVGGRRGKVASQLVFAALLDV